MERPCRRSLALLTAATIAMAGCGGSPSSQEATTTSAHPEAVASSTTTTTTTTTTASTTAAPTTTAPLDPFSLRPPSPATDPAALGEQIRAAETTLRDPGAAEGPVAEAALAQQVAYRQLALHPEWDSEVVSALPVELRAPAQAHVAARRAFSGMHTRFGSTLPAWRIVEPAPGDELMAAYEEAEGAFGIEWQYLAAIHLVETGMGRIRGTSIAGAQGPMQFMPATWAAYGDGGDINDTRDAILGAGRYLAANNGATDIDNALWHYNHSQRYVAGVRAYADLLAAHPLAFRAFYHWGVWYRTEVGDVYLPVGYEEPAPVPVAEYRAR